LTLRVEVEYGIQTSAELTKVGYPRRTLFSLISWINELPLLPTSECTMANIIYSGRLALTKELQRFRNRHFLKASMAASALLALTDDEIQLSERLALDFILENMKELKIFDVHKAVNFFNNYAQSIKEDIDTGKARVFKAVARFSGNEYAAPLIIRACICIAKADGDFSDKEREVVGELCRILKLNPSKMGL
jgi:tellurite resistance protein